MRRPDFIARQSGNPSGILGRILAWVMQRETATHNAAAVAALCLHSGERVLEIGYGHGRTLVDLAALARPAPVSGIDHSALMLAKAQRHCAARLPAVPFDLRLGDTRHLPWPDASFEAVLAVHVLYFWDDPLVHLREVRRVLGSGGRLVLGFRSAADPAAANFPSPAYTFYTVVEVEALLFAAGFVAIETLSEQPEFYLLLACT